MAENTQLDAFLASPPEAAPAPEEPRQEAAQDAEPSVAPEGQAERQTPPAPEKPAKTEASAPEEEDDPEPGVAGEGEPAVPRSAYLAERKKRQDHKERAARFEGENAELRRQLEAAQRAVQQPPAPAEQPRPFQPINPAVDPEGFTQRIQEVMFNERLNVSQSMLVDRLGPEKVAEYITEFREMAKADRSLHDKLRQHPHPYQWVMQQVDRNRVMKEVGDNPDAWREAERKRIREELEAELQASNPPQRRSVTAGAPPSLVNTRSVAARSETPWTGDMPLTDILAGRSKSAGGRA